MTSPTARILLVALLATGCPTPPVQGDDDTADPGDDDDSTEPACPELDDLTFFEHQGDVGDATWAEGRHRVQIVAWVVGQLEIEPCAIVEFEEGASMAVQDGGSLHAEGDPDRPITFTSASDSPSPGDWDNLLFKASADSDGNVLRNVVVEYGGSSPFGSVTLEGGASIAMDDSTVRHSAGLGMRLDDGAELRSFGGNSLVDNAEGPIALSPDQAGELGTGTYTTNGIEGIQFISLYVTRDQTWLAHDAPYVVDSGLVVGEYGDSALLTIAAGTTVLMGEDAAIWVDDLGGLTLAGTELDPVTVTSADDVPAPGDWRNIEFGPGSVGAHNDLDHAVIEYGGASLFGLIEVNGGASVAVTDCTLRHSSDMGLHATWGSELREFDGNTIVDNADGAVSIGVNEAEQLGYGTYGPNTLEGVFVRLDTVDHDATWKAIGVPYVSENGFDIDGAVGDAVLTLEAGSELRLGEDASVVVRSDGGLTLDGTDSDHVTVASALSPQSPGDWHEIVIQSGSVGASNVFRYTDISHGGGSYFGQLNLATDDTEVTLDHVTFSQAGEGCDVYGDGTVHATASTYVVCP